MITAPEPHGVSKGKIVCGTYTCDRMDYRTVALPKLGVGAVTGSCLSQPSRFTTQPPGATVPWMCRIMDQKNTATCGKRRGTFMLAYIYDIYFDDYEYF